MDFGYNASKPVRRPAKYTRLFASNVARRVGTSTLVKAGNWYTRCVNNFRAWRSDLMRDSANASTPEVSAFEAITASTVLNSSSTFIILLPVNLSLSRLRGSALRAPEGFAEV